jgi:glutaredoxin 2
MDELPTVFVYDHCPFCVRVRLALGLKNVKFNLQFLANDDVATPTSLVGKKISPIFVSFQGHAVFTHRSTLLTHLSPPSLNLPQKFPADNLVMGESLDIIKLTDADERFGPTGVILAATDRSDLKAWQKSTQTLLRTLQRPRYVATGLMPEFQQLDGRHAFIKNHQLPPYEKEEWKGSKDVPGMNMADKLRLYAEAMANDPAPLVEELNAKLVELDDIVVSEHHCSEGGLSYDDIDLWARLRSITIIKGVQWPTKLRAYMDNLSALGDVPLYDEMAL